MWTRQLPRFFIVLLTLFLGACTSAHYHQHHAPPADNVVRTIPVSDFTTIQNAGDLDVTIRQSHTPEVIVTGSEKYANDVSATIANNVLVIDSSGNHRGPSPVQIIVCAPYFTRLVQTGSGTIYAEDLQLSKLDVEARSSGNIMFQDIQVDPLTVFNTGRGEVNLAGRMNVQKIIQSGTGPINLHWVDSDNLNIVAYDTGVVTLAGVAKNMDAVLSQHAVLDSKYLRAKRSYVNALSHSTAHVNTTDSLSILSTDHAKVYYYKDPKVLSPYSADRGLIARMVGIDENPPIAQNA